MTTDVFEALRRMAEIVERENQAIESGKFDLVGDLLDEKSSLATALETGEPRIVEALSGGSGAKARAELQAHVVRLRELLTRNAVLTARTAKSLRDVSSELTRLAERDSLGRTYDAKGEIRQEKSRSMTATNKKKTIDQSL
jgi:flagellar biosynthesis/type III secretory pathway chaperone